MKQVNNELVGQNKTASRILYQLQRRDVVVVTRNTQVVKIREKIDYSYHPLDILLYALPRL